MRSFLRLHRDGGLVLVNPDQIQTVFWVDDNGSVIYFTGEDEGLSVDESVEDIDRLVALS